jgi:hypothetical protein
MEVALDCGFDLPPVDVDGVGQSPGTCRTLMPRGRAISANRRSLQPSTPRFASRFARFSSPKFAYLKTARIVRLARIDTTRQSRRTVDRSLRPSTRPLEKSMVVEASMTRVSQVSPQK